MIEAGKRVIVMMLVEVILSGRELARMKRYVNRQGVIRECKTGTGGSIGESESDPLYVVYFGPVRRFGKWVDDMEVFWSEELKKVES